MKFFTLILLGAFLPFFLLVWWTARGTPPPLSSQIDMKSFSPKNLYGYVTTETSDTSPDGVTSSHSASSPGGVYTSW